MTGATVVLRLVGLLGVLGAIVDPGCARTARPVVELTFAGVEDAATRDRVRREVTKAVTSWADVGDTGSVDASSGAVLRAVVGRAGAVLAGIREESATLAIEPKEPGLDIVSVSVPARVMAGTRASVRVAVTGSGEGPIVVTDTASGREEARAELTAGDGPRVVDVPWLAMGEGGRTLRVRVGKSAPADSTVEVVPARAHVRVLEARPTWSTRFARLALASSAAITLETQVRPAPGLQVVTSERAPGAGPERPTAEVVLVGGVDALTAADVTALEVDVRERGRAVVLLMDEPAGGGPWQRLWPGALGRARSAPQLASVRIGPHAWRTREWLALPVSTTMHPLAYVETEQDPVVVGRALGAGRVVVVGALDAWRWRAEPETAFALGWQALVTRLAADVPTPLAVTGWSGGTGADRTVDVEVTARPDIAARVSTAPVVTVSAGARTATLTLWPAGAGVWRGAMRPLDETSHVVEARLSGVPEVAGSVTAVIDVSARAPAATWEDVERAQAAVGGLAVREAGIGEAFQALASTWRPSPGEPWHVTRTWWYAAGVLIVLGSEWILRRAARGR